jgi:hypothetical protein
MDGVLIYRYDMAKDAFGAEERISPTEFRRIIKSVDGGEGTLRLRQYGPPYDQQVDDELNDGRR